MQKNYLKSILRYRRTVKIESTKRKHAIPDMWPIWYFILDPFIIVILCIFIIKISENTDLWRQVITDVNMSPIVILIAWAVMAYSFMKTGIGVYILFTKDRKAVT